MKFDPAKHHRRSIRLRGPDYSQAGAYFITICVQNRLCLFGEIGNSEMRLNDAGRMVQTVWDEIPVYYPGIDIDAFVVMPNHIHGIVVVVGAGPRACPDPSTRACPDPATRACPDPSNRACPDPSTHACPDPSTRACPDPSTRACPDPVPRA